MRKIFGLFTVSSLVMAVHAHDNFASSDVCRLKSVSEPTVLPDKKFVAYTVSSPDSTVNSYNENVGIASVDGMHSVDKFVN
jgi:hypothetical protein